jgi:glyoxylase-like metal-dependent hydrolase (beta-lactamase superfamily II)
LATEPTPARKEAMMLHRIPLLTACALALATTSIMPATAAYAQGRDLSAVSIEATTVAENAAMLTGAGGNMLVLWGPEGTVLVDAQFAPLHDKIQAKIKELGGQTVRYLVNTHWHADHTNGNAGFARAGATIVGHVNVLNRLRNGTTPDAEAMPRITFEEGATLNLNARTIEMIHLPNAHTDSDSVVLLRQQRVMHAGDVFFNKVTLPFIDLSSGGSAYGLLAAIERLVAMTGDGYTIIPGHGPLANYADLVAYRDMLAQVIGHVAQEKAAGKTLEQVLALRLADRWGVAGAFISPDAFVTAIYNSPPPTPATAAS